MNATAVRKAPGKIGAPTDWEYSDALADRIVDRMYEGLNLFDISKLQGYPNRSTIMRWADRDAAFASRLSYAREQLAEHYTQQMHVLMREMTNQTSNMAKIKIDTLRWMASKFAPRIFGDKLDVTADVRTVNTTILIAADLTPEAREALRAALAGSGKIIEHER